MQPLIQHTYMHIATRKSYTKYKHAEQSTIHVQKQPKHINKKLSKEKTT